MAVSKQQIIDWMDQLPMNARIGVDDGGLSLQVVGDAENEFEIGGIPEPEEPTREYEYVCPECKSSEQIDIDANVKVRIVYNPVTGELGTDESLSQDQGHEWNDNSTACCAGCGFVGIVAAFEVLPPTPEELAVVKRIVDRLYPAAPEPCHICGSTNGCECGWKVQP